MSLYSYPELPADGKLTGIASDPVITIENDAEREVARNTFILKDRSFFYMGRHYVSKIHTSDPAEELKRLENNPLYEKQDIKQLVEFAATDWAKMLGRLRACAVVEKRLAASPPSAEEHAMFVKLVAMHGVVNRKFEEKSGGLERIESIFRSAQKEMRRAKDNRFCTLSAVLNHPWIMTDIGTTLYYDTSPLSWGFCLADGSGLTGGILFHHGGGSGGFPEFSVTLTPTHGWSMHT